MVLRRSTTLCTWFNAFNKSLRSIIVFMSPSHHHTWFALCLTAEKRPIGHAEQQKKASENRRISYQKYSRNTALKGQFFCLPRRFFPNKVKRAKAWKRLVFQHAAQQIDIFV